MARLRTARATQIDYDRQMTLVLTDRPAGSEVPGLPELLGVVTMDADPDGEAASLALVAGPAAGAGHAPAALPALLLDRLVAVARRRGIGCLTVDLDPAATTLVALVEAADFRRPDHDGESRESSESRATRESRESGERRYTLIMDDGA